MRNCTTAWMVIGTLFLASVALDAKKPARTAKSQVSKDHQAQLKKYAKSRKVPKSKMRPHQRVN